MPLTEYDFDYMKDHQVCIGTVDINHLLSDQSCWNNTSHDFHLPYKDFHFIKHGRTNWSKEMLALGPQDLHLNAKGIEEVQSASEYYDNKIDIIIISSPLHRCLDTAQILSLKLDNAPIYIAHDIEERFFGNWSQCKDKAEELTQKAPDGPGFFNYVREEIEKILPDDAETQKSFKNRVMCATKRYLNFFSNASILFVAHGCIRIVLSENNNIVVPHNLIGYANPIKFKYHNNTWIV